MRARFPFTLNKLLLVMPLALSRSVIVVACVLTVRKKSKKLAGKVS